jgi:hypothetical protein
MHKLFCLADAESPHYSPTCCNQLDGWDQQQTPTGPSRPRAGWEETTMDFTARLNWAAAMASFVFVAAIILGMV